MIFLRYLFALLYDAFITLALLMLATGSLFVVVPHELVNEHAFLYWLYLLGVNFLWVGYCWTRTGQTIGAKCWKLAVKNQNGLGLSWKDAFKRYFWSVWTVPTGISLITTLILPSRQPIQGFLSKTRIQLLRKLS
ncbi:MAG: hypothetical protein CMF48_01925 [Legionellales bacterium]|nr:hypothetical protein [Legionellales bacterium]|tara:strand:- start:318 stop:722 length:405 start_codon:yes stop_codon:yes gene_type:complete